VEDTLLLPKGIFRAYFRGVQTKERKTIDPITRVNGESLRAKGNIFL
jgi:hypothetical protein